MISIIIPVYNGDKFILSCLRNLAEQTLNDIEIIAVDNNSQDDTAKIIKAFSEKDTRFRYLFCEEQGAASARNAGLDAAQGEYVFFCDCDDLLEKDALFRLLIAAREYNADITFSNILYSKNGKKFDMDNNAQSGLVQSEDIPGMFVEKMPSYVMYFAFKLYKKSFIDKYNLRFDKNVRIGEDPIFNLNAYEHAGSIYYIAQSLYIYQITKDGLNIGYHPDFIENKMVLINKIRAYLNKYNLINENYYTVFLNDVFAMIVNEVKSGNPDIGKILNLDCVKELPGNRLFWTLSLAKRIVYLLIRFRCKKILGFLAKHWR